MGGPANEWDLVIKVRYGDTLRRFHAYVHGQAMDHDMAKLKAKIINFFKLSPEAELVLTYTDEDGDIVTLDADDELHDAAISQRLNPLWINVMLKSAVAAKSDSKAEPVCFSCGGCPQICIQPHQVSYAINEALKSLPEPLHSTLTKIANDFLSKAALSSSSFTEFLEYFSKLGVSIVNQPSQGPSEESLGAPSTASTQPVDLNINYEPNMANDPTRSLSILPSTNSVNPAPEHVYKQHKSGTTIQDVGATAAALADLTLDDPHSENCSMNNLLTSIWTTNNQELEEGLEAHDKGLEAHEKGKADVGAASFSAPPYGQSLYQNLQNFEISSSYVPHCGLTDVLGGDTKHFPAVHPYERSHRNHDSILCTFDGGVRCAGRGMHPNMGPSFKSNVQEAYDLYGICFTDMGNEDNCTKIDQAPHNSPRLFKNFDTPHSGHWLSSEHASHGSEMRQSKEKLESCFIEDVTVVDGTVLPPSTPFTKIWRMRNNGTTAWPCGTQLVWIAGSQLGNHGSVLLEIPAKGCHVDEELDIAVNFTSPSRPGHYISFWKMVSPSGQKFGQQVWVLIQVDNSQSYSASNYHVDINLNLPPPTIGQDGLDIIDVNIWPLDPVTNTTEELVKPSASQVPVQNVELPSVGGLLGANDGVTQRMPVGVTPSLDHIIDFPESCASNASAAVASPSSVSVSDDNPVEQTLLKELEQMGFKQIELNRVILRLNEYDLEQSVNELCAFSEWDPLLQEL